MGSALESLPPGSRVAVIRLRSLGDCVLTTPALHLLKEARPDLRIAVAVEDRFRAVFEGNPDLDSLLAPSASAIRAFRPALCLNLHGGTRSAWMTAFSGARIRAGFRHFQFPFLYNLRIPRAQQTLGAERTVHTAEHLASAVFHLGVPVTGIPRARLFASGEGRVPNAAVIHPVAAAPDKTWIPEGFVAVARRLQAGGLEPVFVGGPTDDLAPFSNWRTRAGAPLSQVKALLAGASLFVGNDSGPAHMAAAFGVPVVVLFGASEPAIWAPWRTASAVLTAPGGIRAIEVPRVLDAIERLGVHA
jgi:lipopolysaccharide heptosyltransferase III